MSLYSREPEWRGPVTDIHGNNFWQQGSMSAISSISMEEKNRRRRRQLLSLLIQIKRKLKRKQKQKRNG